MVNWLKHIPYMDAMGMISHEELQILLRKTRTTPVLLSKINSFVEESQRLLVPEVLRLNMEVKAIQSDPIQVILLMAEILHQLIDSLSHYLKGFIHPRWCRISAINSIWRSRFNL